MAAYKDLVGQKITKVSSNPSDPKTGQMWYNSTDGKIRGLGLVEAFSSASPIITAATKGAGFGPVGGPNIMFGAVTPPSTYINTQIEYNGSGWASDGTYPQSLQGVGVTGVSTAAISVGGDNAGPPSFPSGVYNGPALEYNGSSWTSAPAYPVTSITQIANAGTETAAVFAGGYTYDPGSYTTVTNTNEYNGSSFSSGNAVNTGRQTTVSAGTQTAAIMAGGNIWTSPGATSTSNATEQYDGTSWTSVSNHPKSFPGNGFNSKSENTIINGAIPGGPDSTVFKYDGSSWSTIPGLATGRYQSASGTGSPTNALCVSGRNPGWVTSVEEYNKSTNTITAGAFSSLPSLSTSRWGLGGAGTKSAAIVFGGRNPSVAQDLARSEEYSGSSWSEGPDLNTATRVCGRGTGTQRAALKHGGHSGSPSTSNKTAEEWDGSSWTNGGASTNNHDGTSNLGTQTAAASCGSNPPTGAKTEEYNGTSFSTANDMPYSAYQLAASGSQTAGFVFGGGYPSVTTSANYDGTNWTSGPALVQATLGHVGNGGGGTQTEAIGAAGYRSSPAAYLNNSFTYDGTNFATGPNVGTARSELAGQGANSSFYIAGGLLPPGSASGASEEFTGETTTANIADFTTS